MLKRKHRRYSEKFKSETVELSTKRDCSVAAVARNLGVPPNWVGDQENKV